MKSKLFHRFQISRRRSPRCHLTVRVAAERAGCQFVVDSCARERNVDMKHSGLHSTDSRTSLRKAYGAQQLAIVVEPEHAQRAAQNGERLRLRVAFRREIAERGLKYHHLLQGIRRIAVQAKPHVRLPRVAQLLHLVVKAGVHNAKGNGCVVGERAGLFIPAAAAFLNKADAVEG